MSAAKCLLWALFLIAATFPARVSEYHLFARTNLVPWCIVPFDAKHRGPEERAEMLQRLGFKRFAYDWRSKDITTFDAEVEAMQARGIEFTAWWFPANLGPEARAILGCIERHKIHPQLWVMIEGGPHLREAEKFEKSVPAQVAHLERVIAQIKPIAREAKRLGCKVALYNHGGWAGVPENQTAMIYSLRDQGIDNVGMVYTMHHGYGEEDRFEKLFPKMQPYLFAVSLHGMKHDGDLGDGSWREAPVGQGPEDLRLLRVIKNSGWTGPVAIIGEMEGVDVELRLKDQLDGLDWLVPQLDGAAAGPRPTPRVWKRPADAPDYWAVESASERAALPEFRTISAAPTAELTPANGLPKRDTFHEWHRSHGDNGGRRFSALDQINRQNVTNLEVAWTYHSKDGAANIQCNPVIANGVMFAPTPGGYIVAINASTGAELWRFKPTEADPAKRGLIYWPGDATATERLFFCAGDSLYALNPKTGKPVAGFGEDGAASLPGSAVVAPGLFEHIIVVPGFQRDVFGVDLITGKLLWTFHTVPKPGEFGYETWDKTENYGANCWGGMAMDDARGIAYIATGSHDITGVWIRGDNLFGNCLIALDARTGKRLWHFQDIHHDIWDLDIPAPPNLGTISRDGRRVDVVDVVTKLGNTILLDRVTGKPIFPWRERRAPASTLPGEVTAPYQPDPELPEPFERMEFKPSDLTDISEEATASAITRFKSASTGFFQPNIEGKMNLYFCIHGGAEWTGACVDPDTGHLFVTANHIPWLMTAFRDDDPPDDPQPPRTRGHDVFDARCAQCHGKNGVGGGMAPPLRGLRFRMDNAALAKQIRSGGNGMPAQPDITDADLTALADYLFLRDRPIPVALKKEERPRYAFGGFPKFLDYKQYPACKPPWGTLNCLDLNSGKLLWRTPLGEYPELTKAGIPKTGTENFGGAIVTAGGLVFCAGTRDSKIRAFDKDTGAELWSATLPFVGSAPPACYEAGGKEYIVIAATGGGKLATPTGDAYVAFALPSGR